MAERGTKMTEWNEGRLDDLSDRVGRIETKMDRGFDRLEKAMDEGFARMDAKFEIINQRFDGVYQLLFRASCALIVGLLGLLGLLIGMQS